MTSRKDYEATALILRQARRLAHAGQDTETVIVAIQNMFAATYRRDNPRFDSQRFTKACQRKP